MNRNEGIEKSILKWEILAETGEYRRWIKDITSDDMPNGCALCQLAGQPHFKNISRYRCRRYCPYAQKFGCCCKRGQPFSKWENERRRDNPEVIERRKYYATEIVGQLTQLE